MNIANVTETHGWSGGTNQMFLTAREFKRRGHHVVMICPGGSVLSERSSKAGIAVRHLEIKQDYDVFSAAALCRLLKEEKAHIIHAHHPQAHAVAVLAKYLLAPAALVVTRRVIFPVRRNPFSAIKYRSPVISHFVGVCGAAVENLAKGGVSRKKISFIPSGIELSKWDAARRLRRNISWAPPFRIGMVGHYGSFKGHDVLLKAAVTVLREFPDTRFVFAGRGTSALKSTAREFGIASSTDILGERDDIASILSGLHLFAMPSRHEGIATALMEAQAAGVPAVASRVGGIPDVMIDNKTGLLVPPDKPEALAGAIMDLLRNPQKAGQLAGAGLERVRRLFAIPVVVDRLEKLYMRIVSPGMSQ